LTREAKRTKAVIIRAAPDAPGGRQEVRIDLKKVLSNQASDQQLVANDILYVPDSGVKRDVGTVLNSVIYASVWHIPY
jgi:hypothetical protein